MTKKDLKSSKNNSFAPQTSNVDQPKQKKSKVWLWLTLGCLSFVILAIVIIILVSTLVFKVFSGPLESASEQLKLIRENKMQQAYDLGSNEFKKATSYDDFVQFIQNHPELSKNKKVNFSSSEIKGSDATLQGTMKAEDGSEIPVRYVMIKENGKWKVYYFTINPSGEIDIAD